MKEKETRTLRRGSFKYVSCKTPLHKQAKKHTHTHTHAVNLDGWEGDENGSRSSAAADSVVRRWRGWKIWVVVVVVVVVQQKQAHKKFWSAAPQTHHQETQVSIHPQFVFVYSPNLIIHHMMHDLNSYVLSHGQCGCILSSHDPLRSLARYICDINVYI